MRNKLEIGEAVEYGASRFATTGALVLIVAHTILQFSSQIVSQSLLTAVLDTESAAATSAVIELPLVASAGLFGLIMIGGAILGIVTLRTLYEDTNEFPTDDHLRTLGSTTAVMLVVSLVYGVAVGLGSIALIFPGIFLMVSLIFAQPAVAIEDAGIVGAFERSWELTSGNRLRLFALGVLIVAGFAVIGFFFGIVNLILAFISPLASRFVNAVLYGSLSVFSAAVLVGAYRQLAGDGHDDESRPSSTSPSPDTTSEWAD